ncbi:MAG: radical SAM protein [Dehalococcoidales bacterium]|nr:radical SAM protein [Dehalococcoidales bacterium]
MICRYISLYESGELAKRAERLGRRLASCDICPRDCGVNRLSGETGYCHSGVLPIVSSYCDHHGEEPVLSGSRGSGTIFFANCNLRCLYCQNHQISQNWIKQKANEITCHKLAENMLYLQKELGCHNINLVSPSHFVPQIVEALLEAVPLGFNIPLVYNTNGYDSLETLRELDGIIDIYLPDFKYFDNKNALELSGAANYVETAQAAIKEMYRQVGNLIIDDSGIAQRGLIVRHLILPNRLSDSREVLKWLAGELSPEVTISVMSQYHPVHRTLELPSLSRSISQQEFDEVFNLVVELGMENGWVQQLEAAEYYVPDFERKGHPFAFEI